MSPCSVQGLISSAQSSACSRPLTRAVSMTKCKKRSMMLSEIERVRSEQLCGTSEAQRFAWPGIQLPGNRIQLFLREATQVAALGQILPQQAIRILVDAALPGTVRIGEVD